MPLISVTKKSLMAMPISTCNPTIPPTSAPSTGSKPASASVPGIRSANSTANDGIDNTLPIKPPILAKRPAHFPNPSAAFPSAALKSPNDLVSSSTPLAASRDVSPTSLFACPTFLPMLVCLLVQPFVCLCQRIGLCRGGLAGLTKLRDHISGLCHVGDKLSKALAGILDT